MLVDQLAASWAAHLAAHLADSLVVRLAAL